MALRACKRYDQAGMKAASSIRGLPPVDFPEDLEPDDRRLRAGEHTKKRAAKWAFLNGLRKNGMESGWG